MKPAAIAALGILFCALPAGAQSGKRNPLAADPLLARQAVVHAEGIAVSDLLARLSASAGTPLRAGTGVADEKVIVLGPPRPLHRILSDVALLLNAGWARETRGGKTEWVLSRGLAAQQYEAKLNQAHGERITAQLDELVRGLAETPEQLARRPEGDRVRRYLTEDRFGTRMAVQVYALLGREHRETLFRQNRLKIPFAAFTPEQQAVLRQRYEARIEEQRAANEAFMRENPNSRLPVGELADLERYGVEVSFTRHSGLMSGRVRIGNGNALSLGYVEPGNTLLPPHGNPYTREEVRPDAPLPSPLRSSEAAREKSWVDGLNKLAQAAQTPIVADYYRSKPVIYRQERTLPPAEALKEPAAGLDAFCAPHGYLWWNAGSTLLFRKRDWFIQRQYEVPDRWYAQIAQRLQKQQGVPTHTDVLRVLELTTRQVAGLNNLGRERELDESFLAGLPETLALLRTSKRPLNSPVHVGDLTYNLDGNLDRQVSHPLTPFTRQQAALFERLEAAQPYGIPTEVKNGEFKITLFCKQKEPRTTETNYQAVPIGIKWDLTRMLTPQRGIGARGDLEVHLPLSVPDDRRDRTRVELLPANGN